MFRQLMAAATTTMLVAVLVLGASVNAAAPNLTGSWNFTFNSEGGGREASIEIVQDGTSLKATMGESTLTGTLKDNAVELAGEVFVADAAQTGVLKLTGTLDGDKISGKGAWETYQLTFTASRAK